MVSVINATLLNKFYNLVNQAHKSKKSQKTNLKNIQPKNLFLSYVMPT